MTTLQKSLIAAGAALAVGIGVYQAHQNANLREEVQTLQQQQVQQVALSNQVQELQRERDRATNALAALAAEQAAAAKRPAEVLKLRGEVGRLRTENADMRATSPLSKVTANPEAVKLLRDQQKMGLGMIYKGLTQRLKLTPEQTGQLNDLLADHIMENVGQVTTVLRDRPVPEQINAVFAAQEAALADKVQALLGPDGLAQYQDYTKNLMSTISTEQFKGMLTGTEAEKEDKAKQFRQAMDEAVQAALSNAGLPGDYQTIPMLNFRNIASEQAGDRSLKLLEDIYQRAAARSGGFLTPEDLAKLQEFKTKAIDNNRAALSLNRTLMAPLAN